MHYCSNFEASIPLEIDFRVLVHDWRSSLLNNFKLFECYSGYTTHQILPFTWKLVGCSHWWNQNNAALLSLLGPQPIDCRSLWPPQESIRIHYYPVVNETQ